MFKSLGLVEVAVIAGVLIALFGGKRVNKLARGLGKSSKEIKKVKKEYEKLASDEEEEPTPEEEKSP